MFSPLLIVHIGAGVIGLPFGMAALFAGKGTRFHKKAGNIFFTAMLVMVTTAGILAATKSITASLLVSALSCYLVTTSRVAVTRRAGTIGLFEKMAFLVAIVGAIAGFRFGMEALASDTGAKDGFPAPPYFVFGFITAVAAVADLRMILRGGLQGAQRIVRHLWRMCFVLFVAAASIFLGNQQVFEGFITPKLLFIPVLAIVVVSLFWFIRVAFTGWYKKADIPR